MNSKKNLNIFFTGMFALSTLVSCSKNDEAVTTTANETDAVAGLVEQPDALQSQCSFVDGNWSPSAVLRSSFGSSTDTNFMRSQISKNASVWGRPTVPIRFVVDATNPGSTYNAVSYSNGKIYYGQAIYKDAKTKNANNIVNAMILAHEFGHQLQFALNLPSKTEATVRPNELEADAYAGYYLRKPAGFNAGSFAAIASASDFAFSIGDNDTTSPGHHGTPPQRRSAVRLGFLLADPANVNLTAYNFDSNFFYYYAGVLNGSYRMASQAKPESMTQEAHNIIILHLEELKSIANGTMTDEEYHNLQ